ncbi:hypothetical protein QT980_20240 [Microcoleus sp. Z1_C3]
MPSPDDTLPSVIPGLDSLPAQSDGCERVRVMVCQGLAVNPRGMAEACQKL